MSQKLFDYGVYNIGGNAFSWLFGKEQNFYLMMSPFYVEANQQINALGFPGIPASEENYAKVLQFVIKKEKEIESLSNSYFQIPEVKNALALVTDTNAFGAPAYFGDLSKLNESQRTIVTNYPTSYTVTMAMKYGFCHYAIEPAKSVYKKYLIDIPEMSFSPSNPIEQFQQAFTSAASLWLNSIGPEGIYQTFAGFGKPLKDQQWNPIFAPLQIANSLEGLITGAVILGATAAGASLAPASAEAVAAAPAATAGTTVAEVAVTAGAPAAATGGGVVSTITSWGSAQGAAALATAGAALEAEAKKRVQNAIVDALQPEPDAATGAPGAPTGSSAVPKVVEQKNFLGYALIAALAGLAYFTT